MQKNLKSQSTLERFNNSVNTQKYSRISKETFLKTKKFNKERSINRMQLKDTQLSFKDNNRHTKAAT